MPKKEPSHKIKKRATLPTRIKADPIPDGLKRMAPKLFLFIFREEVEQRLLERTIKRGAAT